MGKKKTTVQAPVGGRGDAGINNIGDPQQPGIQSVSTPATNGRGKDSIFDAHPDEIIYRQYMAWKGKKQGVGRTVANLLDFGLTYAAITPDKVENLDTVKGFLRLARPDEFTTKALKILESGEAEKKMKEKLKPLCLERLAYSLFNSSKESLEEVQGQYLTLKDETELGEDTRNHGFTKAWPQEKPNSRRHNRLKLALNRLAVHWGGGEEVEIRPDRRQKGNPAVGWIGLYKGDVLSDGLRYMLYGVQHAVREGKKVSDSDHRIIEMELEKSNKELAAAGLILGRGNPLEKNKYFDPITERNYHNTILALNDGDDITLKESARLVYERYPDAAAKQDLRRQRR